MLEILQSPISGALLFVLGTLFGSFFNVMIYRIPAGLSVVTPRSRCPKCNHQLRWFENIPVLSYMVQLGKCRECKTPISIQYATVETATGVLSTLAWYLYLLPRAEMGHYEGLLIVEGVLHYATIILLIPISLIDIRHYIIPDSLSLGGLVLALLASFIPGGVTPLQSLYGVLAGGGVLYLFGAVGTAILKKEAMGGGDIKMLAWFGALFGPAIAAGSIFLGAFLGIAMVAIAGLFKKVDMDQAIPFGPALYGGLILSLFWGEQIWSWYYGFFGANL